MPRRFGFAGRSPQGARLLASLAAVVALVASGSASESLAQVPSPTPVETASTIHGWVGARGGPAGLYSWSVGSPAWMHNVSVEGSGSVEITFGTLDDAYGIPVDDIGQAGADLDGPYSEVPERVADVRMQAWLVDVDGTKVVVIVKSFPDTVPALVAEAEAIVGSIRVEPVGTGTGRRLVFTLPAGWDSG